MDQEIRKVMIDDEELWIAGLWSNDFTPDARKPIVVPLEQISKSLEPIVKVSKVLKTKLQELSPDETEVTINLSLGIEKEKIVFGLASMSVETGISVKFLWKKEENGQA